MMNFDNEIRNFGLDNKVPITKDDTLTFLIETIDRYNAKNILEIGTAIGYGCIAMAEYSSCEHIDTVELNKDRYDIATQNVKNKHLDDKITIFHQDALEYISNTDKKYDLVYLDGPKGQYINYLPHLVKLLNPNGIIFADNLHFHGMVTGEIPVSRGCRSMIRGLHRYIDEVTTNPIFDTTIYNIGDGVGVSRLK